MRIYIWIYHDLSIENDDFPWLGYASSLEGIIIEEDKVANISSLGLWMFGWSHFAQMLVHVESPKHVSPRLHFTSEEL